MHVILMLFWNKDMSMDIMNIIMSIITNMKKDTNMFIYMMITLIHMSIITSTFMNMKLSTAILMHMFIMKTVMNVSHCTAMSTET